MNFLKCLPFHNEVHNKLKRFSKKIEGKILPGVVSSQRSIGNGLSSNYRKQKGYGLHRGNWVWTYLSPSLRRQLLTYYNGYKHRKWCVVCLRYDYTLPKLLGEILHDTLKCSLLVNYTRNTRMILVTVVNQAQCTKTMPNQPNNRENEVRPGVHWNTWAVRGQQYMSCPLRSESSALKSGTLSREDTEALSSTTVE